MGIYALTDATTSTLGTQMNTVLTTNLSPDTIISGFISLMPWVCMLVGAIFVFNIAKKLIKGAAKAKVRL